MELVMLAVIAVLVYAVAAYLWRDTPIQRVRALGEEQPEARSGRLRRNFEVLTGSALESGNRIEILGCGDELFPRLLGDLRAAQSLITLQVFWYKPGSLADELAEILLDRAQAGVEALVLLDYFGSSGLDKAYIRRLRDGGVQVRVYRPLHWRTLYKAPHRSHVRSVVVDGRIGYTGGFGIDDRWRGDGRSEGHWRDTHARIEGPAVDQLQAPFLANWAETTGDLLYGDAVLQGRAAATGDHEAAILYCSPSLGSTSAERFLALLLFAAQESLFISSAYFVPPRGSRRLLRQAVARGVDVRVLHPGNNTDHLSTWYAARAYYEELLGAGVRIYEYEPAMMHAKTVVADGLWCSVGSLNFDNRSMKLNDEVTLVAREESLGRRLQELFLQDLDYSREIRLEDFRHRPRGERVWERASLLGASLM